MPVSSPLRVGRHHVTFAVVFERSDVVIFASTLRHRSLPAVPGVGKQMVLFRFLTPVPRHQLVDQSRFILDPLPRAKAEKAHRPCGDQPLPTLAGIPGKGQQGSVGVPTLQQFETLAHPHRRVKSQLPPPHVAVWTPHPRKTTTPWARCPSRGAMSGHWLLPYEHARRPNFVLA